MFLACASKSFSACLDHSDHKSLLFGLPYHCVFHNGCGYLEVSRYTTHISLLQSKWKVILKSSPVTVLLNSLPGSDILLLHSYNVHKENFLFPLHHFVWSWILLTYHVMFLNCKMPDGVALVIQLLMPVTFQ